jgi:hypothetical protein
MGQSSPEEHPCKVFPSGSVRAAPHTGGSRCCRSGRAGAAPQPPSAGGRAAAPGPPRGPAARAEHTLTLALPWAAQLRAQRERVDCLVDDVVQEYHSGFNKSIHNYSQILVRFTQAKEQARRPPTPPPLPPWPPVPPVFSAVQRWSCSGGGGRRRRPLQQGGSSPAGPGQGRRLRPERRARRRFRARRASCAAAEQQRCAGWLMTGL